MTQALNAGPPARRRALFGLLDADGWTWASVKAFAWFIILIFVLGYIPDRAYYFTVNRTLDLGILAWSPVNFCPPENQDLPCPPPVGAVRPWEPSPAELSLPTARTNGAAIQLGTTLLYIGGSDGTAAQADVFRTRIAGTGNFEPWTNDGPALPEPRTDAGVAFFGGSVYVVGGFDATGDPTDTTFVLTPDPQTGALGDWETSETLALPSPIAEAALVPLADGLLLVGGTEAGGAPSSTTLRAPFIGTSLREWTAQASLYTPVSGPTAAQVGDYVWLYGGRGDGDQPLRTVQRGELARSTDESATDAGQQLVRWGVQPDDNPMNLPEGRMDATGWTANGALYLVGGRDAAGTRGELWWAVPTGTGELLEWNHLPQTDLPAAGLVGAAPLTSGSVVFLIGGMSGSDVLAQSTRANLAPQAPFFQVGLVGATVPALKIDGEIGQQIGYLNAAGAGTVGFIAMILIGWAYGHPERTRAALDRVRRRR